MPIPSWEDVKNLEDQEQMATLITGQFEDGTPWPGFMTLDDQVALGNVPGWSSGQVVGRSMSIDDTDSFVWAQGGQYTFEDTASTWYISSSNAADTGQTVVIQGLDNNYNEVTVTVNTNGQNPVGLTTQILAVNKTIIVAGTTNVGDIYLSTDNLDITAGVPNTQSKIKDKVMIGKNISESAIFTVPAGKTLLIRHVKVDVQKDQDVVFQSITQPFGGLPLAFAEFPVYQGFYDLPFWSIGGAVATEKSRLYQVARTLQPSPVNITSGWEYLLAPNA